MEETFLEDVNNILTSGEVPNLFTKDEIPGLLDGVRPDAKKLGKHVEPCMLWLLWPQ